MNLPKCTLCEHHCDPRHSLRTRDGVDYPLCEVCCPHEPGDATRIADACRATGAPPDGFWAAFGYNEEVWR